MARFCGVIGYSKQEETSPGVWTDVITERKYIGDIIRNTRRLESSESLNDDINIANEISIIADPYAYDNFHTMKYVEFIGANSTIAGRWKITSVGVAQRPRLTLTLGGLYNGE